MSGQNVNVCDIGDDVKEILKKFRFQKHNSNSALILKVCTFKNNLLIFEGNTITELPTVNGVI